MMFEQEQEVFITEFSAILGTSIDSSKMSIALLYDEMVGVDG